MTNLPAAYANLYGYSDVRPYEVVSISKSGKQITIRSMKFERDQTWQPEFDMGGFVDSGHDLLAQLVHQLIQPGRALSCVRYLVTPVRLTIIEKIVQEYRFGKTHVHFAVFLLENAKHLEQIAQ